MRLLMFFGLLLGLTGGLAPPTAAQPQQPKPIELFQQVRNKMLDGRFDLAAAYLDALVTAKPTDADIKAIQARYGRTCFDVLRNVRKWSDDKTAEDKARENVELLIKQAKEIEDRELKTDARIRQLIREMGVGEPVEQAYARRELLRAGTFATPIMVDVLRNGPEKKIGDAILWLIRSSSQETIGGWLEAFDVLGMPGDASLEANQFQVLQSILAREDHRRLMRDTQTDFRPFLWRAFAEAKDERFREFARATLQAFGEDVSDRVRAKEALVRIARTFDDRTAPFEGQTGGTSDADPVTVRLWLWDPKENILRPPLSNDIPKDGMQQSVKPIPPVRKEDAEELYALRYTGWVLAMDPADTAAQTLRLMMIAERAIVRGKPAPLSKADPAAYKLLVDAPPVVLLDMLQTGLLRKRTALVLAVTQVLSDRAGTAGAPPRGSDAGSGGPTPLLVQALEYPDPQVQLAAANALLRSPIPLGPKYRSRVLEVMKRAAAATPANVQPAPPPAPMPPGGAPMPPGGAAMDPPMPGAPAPAPLAVGRVLVADPDPQRSTDVATRLRQLGYTVEVFPTGRDLQRRVAHAADFDLLVVDHHIVLPQVFDLVSQLRADVNVAGRPILVIASADEIPRPSIDMLLFRYALLIAVTDTTAVITEAQLDQIRGDPRALLRVALIPPPFVPDITKPIEVEERRRRSEQEQRDAGIRRLLFGPRVANLDLQSVDLPVGRVDRLYRALDAAALRLTTAQREVLRLKAELISYAIIAAEFPVTPESTPATVERMASLRKQIEARYATPPYTSAVGIPEAMGRLERLELEVVKVPQVQARYVRLWEQVDPASLGLNRVVPRDQVAETRLAKAFQRLPGVHVIPEPVTPLEFDRDTRPMTGAGLIRDVGLARDVRLALSATPFAPRDPAEVLDGAKLAVSWLRRMALDELPGYAITSDWNPRNTEEKLRQALLSQDLADAAIDAVARFATREAEQALLDVAIEGLADLKPDDPAHIALRVKAADAAIRHIQMFSNVGNVKGWASLSRLDHIAALAAREKNPELRAKFVVLNGLLISTPRDLVRGLRSYELQVLPTP